MDKVKLRATFVVEYEADPSCYSDEPSITPEEMARIDQENSMNDQEYAESLLSGYCYTCTVEVVK